MAEPDLEILELAISREVEAYHFYMSLAKRVAGDSIHRIFEELAKEELEHKEELELEIIKLGYAVPENRKLTRSQHSHIISNTDSKLDMDYKDMLLLGMEKEEASFRTYVSLIPQALNEESKEVLLSLAEEEVRHKLRFQIEYELLQKQK